MVQVKAELGPEAVILHTNEIKVGGVFGLFGHRMIQVMAAVEEKPVLERTAAATQPKPAPEAHPGRPLVPPAPPAAAVPQPAPQPLMPASGGADVAVVREELAGMKELMGQIVSRLDQPAAGHRLEAPLRDLLGALTRGGVQEEAAVALVNRVRGRLAKGQATLPDALEVARSLMIKDLGGVKTVAGTGRVVALVGPTGVGKTTTLAKLAAHLSLNLGKRVALVTADTYRIAAVEQLRTYSEIIGVPLEVVYDPADVAGALAAHSECDLILVDTAGRSPRNQAHMNELKAYLDVMEPAETYLVLSMTSGFRDATMIVDHYLPMGFDHFLFTKWDESATPGLIYNMVQKYKRPLSYVTTGQNVPDDIEVADPETIIRAILGV
jgi:flagellar biosynthesis protein FlhF